MVKLSGSNEESIIFLLQNTYKYTANQHQHHRHEMKSSENWKFNCQKSLVDKWGIQCQRAKNSMETFLSPHQFTTQHFIVFLSLKKNIRDITLRAIASLPTHTKKEEEDF